MTLSREAFEDRIAVLQAEAHDAPGRYRLRVVGWIALGYAVLLLGLVMAVAALSVVTGMLLGGDNLVGALRAAIFIGLPACGLLMVLVRALFVRLDPPRGLTLTRSDSPKVFKLLDRIRQKMGGPPVHQVLLVDELNAAIAQYPRLGMLGWHRNILVIGLPLLLGLSLEQAGAVLAHEYGHLTGAHGKFAAWVYRTRSSWQRIFERVRENPGGWNWPFARFIDFFFPRFDAYTFVLARQDEYEADRLAARVAGTRHMAEALTRVKVLAGFMGDRYWPGLLRQADERPTPPYLPNASLSKALRLGLGPADAQRWLDRALAESTGVADTHPALADRLAALDQTPRLPMPPRPSAAEALFGPALKTWTHRLDREWLKQHGDAWKQRFRYVEQGRARLLQWKSTPPETRNAAWERATLVEDFDGPDAALPLYHAVLVLAPDDAPAHFAVGRLLLGQGEDAGLRYLDEAMRLDHEALLPGCELAFRYLSDAGRRDEARVYAERAGYV